MFIVDAHLDLAYNVLRGRDVTLPAAEQPVVENEIATVGLPDLRAGGVGMCCATIFCSPRRYTSAEEARELAIRQLNWYRLQIDEGRINFVRSRDEVPEDGETASGPLRAILLMEGADAFRSPVDVGEWFEHGLRIVGLAWGRTRAAGGTDAPGPLTTEGRAVVHALDKAGIIHDTSHLADESFWQLVDLTGGSLMASHSNCRAIVPTDRQLSDGMIKTIASRHGMIGINFYDKFLMPPAEIGKRRCALADLIAHVKHMSNLVGGTKHIGLGSDLDGGVGRNDIAHELTTAADMPIVADALNDAGFGDDDVLGIMGRHWLSFFRRALPG